MGRYRLREITLALLGMFGLILAGVTLGLGSALMLPGESGPSAPPPAVDTQPMSGPAATANATPTGNPPDGGAATGAVPAGGTAVSTQQPNSGQGSSSGTGELTASLGSTDVSPELGGVEVVVQLHNSGSEAISFSFSADKDMSVKDDRENPFALRWAEYSGSVTVPAGQSVQLVKAFFAGPLGGDVQYLTVSVEHPPQLPGTSWQVKTPR